MVVIWRLRYLSAKDNNLICVRKDRNNSLNFQIFRQLFLSGSQNRPLTQLFFFICGHGDRHLGMGACFHGNFFAICIL